MPPSNNNKVSETGPRVRDPRIKPRSERRISWIWLVPFVAVLVGGSLLVQSWLRIGPTVTISFESAEGLEVGQTKVRYKDVVVGLVTGIRVSADRTRVLVSAELNREGSSYITQEDTRFWVVRPRLALSGVSGLGTLLSGAYIGVDAAESKAEDQDPVYTFTGLEKPPEITSGHPGTRFSLHSAELGSLDIGSPVYYRRIQVGRVIGYDLEEDGQSVKIQVFIDAPNDKFVTTDARFWNASGVNFSLSADGLNVQTGSLVSVVAGGIAFASGDPLDRTPAGADSVFRLADSQASAMADPDGPPFAIELQLQQSVRGLSVGAPVEFRGMELGKVVDIDLEFNVKERYFYALVKAELYPLRFGTAYERLNAQNGTSSVPGGGLMAPMVKRGLRAQLRTANILTGQQYVALDFFPKAEPVDFDPERMPVVLPSVPGDFDRLQEQISSIVSKLDEIPFDGIGKDLRASLSSIAKLVNTLDTQVAPQAGAVLKAAKSSLRRVDEMLAQDSSMSNNLDQTLREISTAAKSLRALADYLQTHPTALLRGAPRDALTVSP